MQRVLTLLSSKLCGSCWRENFLPREWVFTVGWGCGVLGGCKGGYWACAEAGVAGVETELLRMGTVVWFMSRTDSGRPARISSSLYNTKNVQLINLSS